MKLTVFRDHTARSRYTVTPIAEYPYYTLQVQRDCDNGYYLKSSIPQGIQITRVLNSDTWEVVVLATMKYDCRDVYYALDPIKITLSTMLAIQQMPERERYAPFHALFSRNKASKNACRRFGTGDGYKLSLYLVTHDKNFEMRLLRMIYSEILVDQAKCMQELGRLTWLRIATLRLGIQRDVRKLIYNLI